ncbi:MAG: glycosyltransferase [Ignavibacteriaceae bacterium]
MSYRFVKVTSFYRDYLNYYYAKADNNLNYSYDVQYKKLMGDCFAWADFYQQNLQKIGIEAFEIVYNAEPLQQAWAKEHGTVLKNRELLFFQLKTIAPEIVFFQDSNLFNGEWIDYLKREIPSIKKVIGWCCNPFTSNQIQLYKNFDFMLTCSPAFNERFIESGLKSFQLMHAFETNILDRINTGSVIDKIDFLFIGSLIPSNDFHDARIQIIEELLYSGVYLKVYSKLNIDSNLKLIAKKIMYYQTKILMNTGFQNIVDKNLTLKKFSILKSIPRNPGISGILRDKVKPPVFGLEMYNTIADSNISLNIHGGVAGNYAANIRLFEITGAGSCMVTDWKKNLNDIFEIDTEVVAFKTAEECIEKVKWLLNNPTEREKISRAGQRRVLKDHTFAKRALQLDEIIRKELNNL